MLKLERVATPGLLSLVAGVVALAVLAGCATTPLVSETSPRAQSETLEAEPLDGETANWLTTLQAALGGDARFGAVSIDDARAVVSITWHGEPSSTLLDHISRAPQSIEVHLQKATFRPGDLQALVRTAMEPGAVPGVEIAIGSVRSDASGLEFGVVELPAGQTTDDVAASIADAVRRADVPIAVTVSGSVVALRRSSPAAVAG